MTVTKRKTKKPTKLEVEDVYREASFETRLRIIHKALELFGPVTCDNLMVEMTNAGEDISRDAVRDGLDVLRKRNRIQCLKSEEDKRVNLWSTL